MNTYGEYKRTEGKGYYENKVIVYDITHCVDDENTYYSYMDPIFDIRRLSTTKDKFLDKFVFIGKEFKRQEFINPFSEGK